MTPEPDSTTESHVPEDQRQRLRALRHDLRTQLTHIIGYSDMLQDGSTPQSASGFLADVGQIQRAGRRLLNIIHQELNPENWRLLDIIHEALDPENHRGGPESLSRIDYEFKTQLNAIIGYEEMLHEEAEEQGRETLAAELGIIGAAALELLSLVNTNLAVPDIEAGAGEGGKEERGTPAPDPGPRPTVPSPHDPGIQRRETVPGSILVADDDETSRDLISRRLRGQGHTVALAESGQQALDMLRANQFDLVLLNMIMPNGNGQEVLRSVKADEDLRHIPVIVRSSLDDMESVVRCIEMGADDYLPKPCDQVLLMARIGACLEKKRLADLEASYLQRIETERKRADDLLHVIFPGRVADELQSTNTVTPRRYENVAVMFCDIEGFTEYCDVRQPEEVVNALQAMVEVFEDLALKHGLEKIKTVGDSFMASAGLLEPVENPVLNCVKCGLEMISSAWQTPARWRVRIGIHVGPVVAGVVGRRQYSFDLWGDTVNTAARIESHGRSGAVNLSRTAWLQIKDQASAESLGPVAVKGKGPLDIYRFQGFNGR